MPSRRRKSAPKPESDSGLVRVYPSTDLPEGAFVPGVGTDGADVSPELAAEWHEAGLVRYARPRSATPDSPLADQAGAGPEGQPVIVTVGAEPEGSNETEPDETPAITTPGEPAAEG
jgi:hypothetical protein